MIEVNYDDGAYDIVRVGSIGIGNRMTLKDVNEALEAHEGLGQALERHKAEEEQRKKDHEKAKENDRKARMATLAKELAELREEERKQGQSVVPPAPNK